MRPMINTPLEPAILKLEARKSFAFGMFFTDDRDNGIDLRGCTIELTRATTWPPAPGQSMVPDADVQRVVATMADAQYGYVVFNWQADELTGPIGTSPFTITLTTAGGYSFVVMKGDVQLLENTEYHSDDVDFTPVQAGQSLQVKLKDQNVVRVTLGTQMPPNSWWLTDEEKAKIAAITVTSGGVVVDLTAYATKVQAQAWDATVLSSAATDATSKANTALTSANSYTDGKVSTEATTRLNADINEATNRSNGDAATLASAKAYVGAYSLNKPVALTPSTDLNSLTTDGVYFIDTVALANTILNLPVPPIPASGSTVGGVRAASKGLLEVRRISATSIVQEFTMTPPDTVFTRPFRFLRTFGNGIWGGWLLQTPAISCASELQQDTAAKILGASYLTPVTIRRTDQVSTIPYTSFTGDTWTSDSGTPVSAPNWTPIALNAGFSQYGGSYLQSRARRTAMGLVLLSGLIVVNSFPANGIIGTLPPGMRPAAKQMFTTVGSSAQGSSRIDIMPNGDIVATGLIATGGALGFLSLAGIQFWCNEAAPDAVWTPLTMINSFYSYHTIDPTWPVASYYVDPLGKWWFRGLVGRASNHGADMAYANLPSIAAPNKQCHYAAMGIGGFSSQHVSSGASPQLVWKNGSTGITWFSAPQHPIMPVAQFPESLWLNLTLLNSWTNYDPAAFPPASIYIGLDGIVHVRGLIRNGTSGSQIALLGGGGVGHTALAQAIWSGNSNNAYARTDIGGNSMVSNVGSTAWWSLDNIIYLRES